MPMANANMAGYEGGLFFGGTEALNVRDNTSGFCRRSKCRSPLEAGSDGSETEQSIQQSDGEGTPSARSHGISSIAAHKPITDKFDAYDQRLYDLKITGYSNDEINRMLVKQGFPSRVASGIAQRFNRLRARKEQLENDILDDELTDWHVGEDELLEDALAKLKEKYELERQKIESRKWEEVSKLVAEKMGKKKYTAKACSERWAAVQDGTALKPVELDSDQEGRRISRETRVAANKKARAAAKAAVKAEIVAAQEKKGAKAEKKLATAKQREEDKIAREADKAETKRLIEQKRREAEKEKADKKEARILWMRDIEETRKIRELEERIYRNITGKQLNRMRCSTKLGGADYDDGASELDSDDDEEDEEGYITDNELNAEINAENEPEDMHDITSDREEDACASDIASDDELIEQTSQPAPTKAKVTAQTLVNPRSVLTDAELEVLLHERNLHPRTRRETHPQVIARLAAADESLSLQKLNDLLSTHFDYRKGNKAEKVQRLAELDAQKSAAGENGVFATDLEFKKGYAGYSGKFAALLG